MNGVVVREASPLRLPLHSLTALNKVLYYISTETPHFESLELLPSMLVVRRASIHYLHTGHLTKQMTIYKSIPYILDTPPHWDNLYCKFTYCAGRSLQDLFACKSATTYYLLILLLMVLLLLLLIKWFVFLNSPISQQTFSHRAARILLIYSGLHK